MPAERVCLIRPEIKYCRKGTFHILSLCQTKIFSRMGDRSTVPSQSARLSSVAGLRLQTGQPCREKGIHLPIQFPSPGMASNSMSAKWRLSMFFWKPPLLSPPRLPWWTGSPVISRPDSIPLLSSVHFRFYTSYFTNSAESLFWLKMEQNKSKGVLYSLFKYQTWSKSVHSWEGGHGQ